MGSIKRAIILSFLLIGISACEKPVDPNKTKAALSWLKKYYKASPIGGGWAVTDISAESNHLNVNVIMMDKDASNIMKYETERQLRILSVVCPNKHEKIWGMIDTNHLIEIHVSSPGYGRFSSFDCEFVQKLFRR